MLQYTCRICGSRIRGVTYTVTYFITHPPPHVIVRTHLYTVSHSHRACVTCAREALVYATVHPTPPPASE